MIKKIIKNIADFAGYVFVKKLDNELESTSSFNRDIIKKFSRATWSKSEKYPRSSKIPPMPNKIISGPQNKNPPYMINS